MSLPFRRSALTLIVVALAVGAAVYFTAGTTAAGAYGTATAGGAASSTTLALAGLQQQVDVYRDDKGTPHIFAASEDDLFLAYGYVMAEDRLFQMDYLRRVTAGRVAEVRGPAFVRSDRYFRTLGYKQLADAVIAKTDRETLRILEQFSKGINAYIDANRSSLPVEFTELGYAPEPWTPTDSLLSWYNFGHVLDVRRWENEIAAGEIVARFGKEGELLLPGSDNSATIVQPGEMPGLRVDDNKSASADGGGLNTDDALLGSNNWVVSPRKSATGKVLLASDPHVRITAPAAWHEAHLRGGRYDVAGVAFPGVPAIFIGHNTKIAWAVTWATVDSMDVYEERINDASQYQYMGTWMPLEVRRETIAVKGGAPVTLDVRATRHGPVVTDVMEHPNGKQYSLRWANHDIKANEVHAYRLMNTASSWEEFKAGVKLYNTLCFNFLYGDAEGNIGYHLGTAIPIRKKGIGNVPMPGWTDEYEWKGYVPFEENPHVYNPARGWIATANNKIAGDWYPYFLSNPGNTRAERIHEMLQAQDQFSIDDFKRMQSDTHSTQPRPLVPLILKAFEGRLAPAPVQTALQRLGDWKNHDFERDSIAATIYNAVYGRIAENTFLDELKGDDRLLGRISGNISKLVAAQPGARWFDNVNTPARETLNDILAKSVEEGVAELTRQFGSNQDEWRWDRYNQIDIPYQLPIGSGLEPLSDARRLGPFPKEGRGGWTVNPVSGNSYRMLVDFADLDRTETQMAPGNSGVPSSPHFSDQAQMWVDGTYKPKPHSRGKVAAAAASHRVLVP